MGLPPAARALARFGNGDTKHLLENPLDLYSSIHYLGEGESRDGKPPFYPTRKSGSLGSEPKQRVSFVESAASLEDS